MTRWRLHNASAQRLRVAEDVAAGTQTSDGASLCTGLSLSAPCTYLEPNSYVLVAGLQKAKPVRLAVRYDPSGLNLTAQTREYTFADIDLTSLRLQTRAAELRYPALGQAEAYAVFGGGHERPVTRYVSWSTEDSDLLSVVDNGIDGGLLVPQNLTGTARVYASTTSPSVGKIDADLSLSTYKQ